MSNPVPQQTYGQYKLRRISWNKFGDIFGITIPRDIATKHLGTKFTIVESNNQIILKSGIDISDLKKEIESYDIDEWSE